MGESLMFIGVDISIRQIKMGAGRLKVHACLATDRMQQDGQDWGQSRNYWVRNAVGRSFLL